MSFTKSAFFSPDWKVYLDLTAGDPDLQSGSVCLGDAGDILLAYTYAQSRRDHSPQAHALNAIDPAGSLLWSLPWEITGEYALTSDGLIVIGYASTAYEPLNQPPLEAHWLVPENGRTCFRQRIWIPDHLWDFYRRAPRRWLTAVLEYSDGNYHLQVRASDAFKSYPHAIPSPPGGADFSQALAALDHEIP